MFMGKIFHLNPKPITDFRNEGTKSRKADPTDRTHPRPLRNRLDFIKRVLIAINSDLTRRISSSDRVYSRLCRNGKNDILR